MGYDIVRECNLECLRAISLCMSKCSVSAPLFGVSVSLIVIDLQWTRKDVLEMHGNTEFETRA